MCYKRQGCGLWFHLSSEHFDVISTVYKSVDHGKLFSLFKNTLWLYLPLTRPYLDLTLADTLAVKRRISGPLRLLGSLQATQANNEINVCDLNHSGFYFVLMLSDIAIYYIDMSVLLENIPLVKFIKTTSGTQVVYFP